MTMPLETFSLPSPNPSGLVQQSNGHWKPVKRGEGGPLVTPEPLLMALMGFGISQILMTAHALGLFSALKEGPQRAEKVCETSRLPVASGRRILAACAALGFLIKEGEYFSNTPLAQTYLLPDSPFYLGGLLQYYQMDFYPSYGHLKEAVLQNAPQVASTEGPTDIFSRISQDTVVADQFLQAMHSLALLEGKKLAGLFPFEQINRLLDVGGGSGAIAAALAEAYPHLRLQIFDRPAICAMAGKTLAPAPHLALRMEWTAGDFWKDPLPSGADAVLLSMVLHDWSLEDSQRLLQKCHAALPRGGVLLIFEQLLQEDRQGPLPAVLTDITMLLRTAGGGERTESDYRKLLEASDFQDVRVSRGPGLRQLIWARKN